MVLFSMITRKGKVRQKSELKPKVGANNVHLCTHWLRYNSSNQKSECSPKIDKLKLPDRWQWSQEVTLRCWHRNTAKS